MLLWFIRSRSLSLGVVCFFLSDIYCFILAFFPLLLDYLQLWFGWIDGGKGICVYLGSIFSSPLCSASFWIDRIFIHLLSLTDFTLYLLSLHFMSYCYICSRCHAVFVTCCFHWTRECGEEGDRLGCLFGFRVSLVDLFNMPLGRKAECEWNRITCGRE